MMFKTNGFEDEIYRSMIEKLSSNQLEDNYGFKKLSKATDYLNAAAELFEKAGMHEQSSEIINFIEELSSQFSNKK